MSELVDELMNRDRVFVPQEGIDTPYSGAPGGAFDYDNDEDYDDDDDDSDYDTDDSLDDELKLINAQLQWEESLEQLKTLVGFVILPLIGKMLGRRVAGFGEYILLIDQAFH